MCVCVWGVSVYVCGMCMWCICRGADMYVIYVVCMYVCGCGKYMYCGMWGVYMYVVYIWCICMCGVV